MVIRFSEALSLATAVIRRVDPQQRVVLVRDVRGALRAAFKNDFETRAAIDEALEQELGKYYGGPSLVGTQMLAPEAIFQAPDLRKQDGVWVLERTVTGDDWNRPPLSAGPHPPRVTFYGLKGGVGRSTALVVAAQRLAQQGRKVLVIDLDLESPGVSSFMLPPDSIEFGVVDWLVEGAVDNADEALLGQLAHLSPLGDATGNNIRVVPCGAVGPDYLAKLSRAYLCLMDEQPITFADRIGQLIERLEATLKPDVVLLDSRAGLHDIAAVAVTRLDAQTLLFAANSQQSWDGYRSLFAQWATTPPVALQVRQRLKMVAAQVPETERKTYLSRYTQKAYDAFNALYTEQSADDDDAFNFDVFDTDAPHSPLPIYWSREFQDWDPLASAITPAQISAAYDPFVDGLGELIQAVQMP